MVFDEPADIEWALVPALQLAEGGKTLKERRIGMLPSKTLGKLSSHVSNIRVAAVLDRQRLIIRLFIPVREITAWT